MSEKKDAFIASLKEQIGYNPKMEDVYKGEIARRFYANLRGGNIKKHTTTTLGLYIQQVLPELSCQQVSELIATVHVIIETILTYLVEDGLIKED